jgi:hypothetical protein
MFRQTHAADASWIGTSGHHVNEPVRLIDGVGKFAAVRVAFAPFLLTEQISFGLVQQNVTRA